MSTPVPVQSAETPATQSGNPYNNRDSMETTGPDQRSMNQIPVEPSSAFGSSIQILTPTSSDSGEYDPFDEERKATMDIMPMPMDARSVVRLLQCQQCSFPLRSPVTLPCGNSLCSQYCLPERFKRENISYPVIAARVEGFICPFKDCGQEHSVADCSMDVTLSKVIERIALEVADHRVLNDSLPTRLDEQLRPRTDMEELQIQTAGVSGPVPSSIILSGGTLAATYTMVEQGKLHYDSEVIYTPPATPPGDTTDDDLNNNLYTHFSTSARTEVDCQLCWNLLYEPLTTTCGHTFCRSCVARMLEHSHACPFCRKPLQLPAGVRDVVGNQRLQNILSLCWSTELAERKAMIIAEVEAARDDIPIFVCTLGFPDMPTFLHIFEPRYRLMIRRVVESESKTFGMVMYNSRRTPQGLGDDCVFMRQGILLKINATAMLPDGRSLIECIGMSRFNVTEWRESDGYVVGRIERIEDVSLETEERLEAEAVQRGPGATTAASVASPPISLQSPLASPSMIPPPDAASAQPAPVDPLAELEAMSTAELFFISTDFVRRMRTASAPWLNDRMLQSYGQPPVDARTFPYWFASVLPIAEDEKYELLGMTSVRERVKRTAKWVRRIEAQRW